MSKRREHTGKSRKERENYFRYIKRQDYDPTTTQPPIFSSSDIPGEELKEPSTNIKRPIKVTQKIKDYFADNWVNWSVSLLFVVIVYLMVDSKINIARINFTIASFKENITSLATDLKKLNEKNHEQDLSIMEHRLRINNLEKQIDISGKKR